MILNHKSINFPRSCRDPGDGVHHTTRAATRAPRRAGLIGFAPTDQGCTRTTIRARQIVQLEGNDLTTTGQQVAHGQHQRHVADGGKVSSGGGKDLGNIAAAKRRRLALSGAEAPGHALERQPYGFCLGWVGQAGGAVQGGNGPDGLSDGGKLSPL